MNSRGEFFGFRTKSILTLLAVCLPATVATGAPPAVKLFPLTEVRLLDGPFKHAQDVNRQYMFKHDSDRLLAPFRTEAGLEPKAEMYHDLEDRGLAGHLAGHYLSALAQLYASTGDQEAKKRLDYMVSELAECQKKLGDGYVGGIPNSVQAFDQMGTGVLVVNDPFHLNGLSVPWYNLHKTFAGLRDAWLVAGNAQAREVLIGLADWCDVLTANLFDEQMQQMLDVEHAGMIEVLADLSEITGNKKYLALAKRFAHRKMLDDWRAKHDNLDNIHANTQIPKAIGAARYGELTNDAAWVDAGRFFWDNVATHRTLATGGQPAANSFAAKNNCTRFINAMGGSETCCAHNMLRLTEQLFRLEPDAKYADFYERALFNHILSSQHPETGGFVYITPMRPRYYRIYSQAEVNLWCCVGTGMQSQTKHGRFIYAATDDSLYVNLFIASELNWAQRKVKLRQETGFPDVPQTRLVVSTESPSRWTMRVRSPGWVRPGDFQLSINGEQWQGETEPGTYVAIEREWRDGDRVDVKLPMHASLERLPDGTNFAALLYGPIVLSAKIADATLEIPLPRPVDGSFLPTSRHSLPLETAPKLVGSDERIIGSVTPVAGRPLVFKARDVIGPDEFRDLELIPFSRIHDTRYMIYWQIEKLAE
jgi:DUF1680 family protein